MGLQRQHTADGEIEFVHMADEAWDHERIATETDLLSEDEIPFHPWYLYHAGRTRYDLGLVRDYLREGVAPTTFRLRRLGEQEWAEVQRLRRSGSIELARVYAWRHGVVSVAGVDTKLEGPDLRRGELTDKDRDTLRDYLGDVVLSSGPPNRTGGGDPGATSVGEAVLRASAPLTDDEKKRFVSLSGDTSRLLATRTAPTP